MQQEDARTTMLDAYIRFVIRWRWSIVITTLALVVLAASGGQFLRFNTDYRVFFGGNDPYLDAFNKLQKTYTKNDNILFVIAPNDKNVFTKRTLEVIEQLTNAAWKTPYSIRVDSLTNFQHTYARGDELVVENLVTSTTQLTANEIERIKSVATSETLLVDRLVSASGHVTAVNVTVQLPGRSLEIENPRVVSFARKLVAQIEADHPEVDIYLTGVVMVNNAFYEAARDDMMSLVPIMFLVLAVVLGLLLRSVNATLITFLVIVLSILTTLGIGGWLGIELTPPSSAAPTIITTLAVADCVHLIVTYMHGLFCGQERKQAVADSLRINFAPVTLTTITTVIGFLSMNFATSPPFNDLGNLVAMGVTTAYFISIAFLPAVLTLIPVRVSAWSDRRAQYMNRFGRFVVNRRRVLLWGVSIVTIGLVLSVPKNEFNDEFIKYFDHSVEFRNDTDFTTSNLTGIYQIEYSLNARESGAINEPGFLQKVSEFAQWYRRQPEVWHVNTITDIMKRLNKNMHDDDPAAYDLPKERRLAAQYLLLYEMSLPFGLDLNNQINVDKSATRFTVSIESVSANQLITLSEKAQRWLKKNAPPGMQVVGSGPAVMFSHIGAESIRTGLLGGTAALVMISMLLIVAFRSIKVGLLSLIPNLIPAGMAFGLWGLMVGQVNMALSTVIGMTLGIVVDNTIHFLSKYLRARREQRLDASDAVLYAFSQVGVAIVVISVVLIAGFLVLTNSSFVMNWGMGLMTVITVSFALIADFLLLPPLLIRLEEVKREKAGVALART